MLSSTFALSWALVSEPALAQPGEDAEKGEEAAAKDKEAGSDEDDAKKDAKDDEDGAKKDAKDDDEGDAEGDEADDADKEEKAPGKTKDLVPYVEFGIGGLGHLGGNFLDKPDDQRVEGGLEVRPEYPGFAGFTKGGGIMVIDVRFLEIAGFELDVLFTSDAGEAELDHTDLNSGQTTTYHVKFAHAATHIPLLVKLSIPGDYVQPVLLFGPEFVLPKAPKGKGDGGTFVQGTNPSGTQYSAFNTGNYTMFTFGIGLEVKLPIPIPYVGFRIPFQLRGSVNPGVKGKRTDRERDTNPSGPPANDAEVIEYSTEWKFQAAASFGLGVYF